MRRPTNHRLAGFMLATAVVVAACGGGTAETTTAPAPTTTPATTQATATTATAPAVTTAPSVTTTVATTDTPMSGALELLISAQDSEGFSTNTLEAKVGEEVSVTFENKDTGAEPHNWHVFIDPGKVEYATLVKGGPDSQTVTFTVGVAGEYKFQCDTHPTAMFGTLIVTP